MDDTGGRTSGTHERDGQGRAGTEDRGGDPPAPDGARITFWTMTGSRYEIDFDAMTWRRIPTLASGRLPSEGGALDAVLLGGPGRAALLYSPPLVPGGPSQYVHTSAIVAFGMSDDV